MRTPSPIPSLTAEHPDRPLSLPGSLRAAAHDTLLGIVDDAEEHDRLHREFDRWVREVRDPAAYRSEGPRRLVIGSCSCEYEIAGLRDGRSAMRCYVSTGTSGSGSPWTAFDTRSAALDAFLAQARRHFERHTPGGVTDLDRPGLPRMLARLNAETLFGFEEPDPVPRDEWYPAMIADRIGFTTMERGWELLDVVRGLNCSPISKSGSFFDIPLPAGMAGSHHRDLEDDGDEGDADSSLADAPDS